MHARRFLAAATLLALPLIALAQNMPTGNLRVVGPGRFAGVVEETLTSTVVSIDTSARRIVLERTNGERVSVLADARIRNLDRLQIGDKIAMRFTQALVLELSKGGAGVRERIDSSRQHAAQDAEMGGLTEKKVAFVADVQKVDAGRQTVTLRGVRRTMQLRIKDPAQLKLIAKGDQVEGVYSEAVAISVKSAVTRKKVNTQR